MTNFTIFDIQGTANRDGKISYAGREYNYLEADRVMREAIHEAYVNELIQLCMGSERPDLHVYDGLGTKVNGELVTHKSLFVDRFKMATTEEVKQHNLRVLFSRHY